jgi:hypothetical protein
MLVTSRIQERHAAGLKDHREWLEDLTRVATEHHQRMADHARWMEEHARSMEDHRLRMQAIDERLEQIGIKVDRICRIDLPGSTFERSRFVTAASQSSGRER